MHVISLNRYLFALIEFLGDVMFRVLGGALAALLVSGCAIHPVPEDVTGVKTSDIVKQIRCEARQAIFDYTVKYLVGGKNPNLHDRNIGLEFQERRRPIHELSYKLFKGEAHDLIKLFWETGIAYNFQLQMLETNNIDPTTDLLTFSGKNQFSSPVTGSADRTRQNTRTFTVSDTFGFLINNIPDDPDQNKDFCGKHIVGPNYVYPVAGRIGIDHMIGDFVNLTLFEGLGSPPSNAANPTTADIKGPPTMVDQLQFTTLISLGATPKVTFAPVRTFVDASIGLKAARQDTHTVTIGLAISNKKSLAEVATLRAGIFPQGPLGQLVSANPTTSSELAAVIAVNQVLTQQVFKPVINLTTN
ncbi:hypothetical protein [Bradyrhizobium yuanmingense]|uniref:hypothetical protein n=1 Tax=Bradyrhizobium yuanmingense TaxID=108015 RepID=UPI003514BA10